jgi:hypothetical protein
VGVVEVIRTETKTKTRTKDAHNQGTQPQIGHAPKARVGARLPQRGHANNVVMKSGLPIYSTLLSAQLLCWACKPSECPTFRSTCLGQNMLAFQRYFGAKNSPMEHYTSRKRNNNAIWFYGSKNAIHPL